jgi:hypothetical protein
MAVSIEMECMKFHPLPLIFLIAVLTAQSALAQPIACPKELKWTDATYLQGNVRVDAQLVKADIEIFSNVTVVHLDAGGTAAAAILSKKDTYATGINLTFGSGPPKPLDFAEISMIAAPPMSDGKWPRFSKPCQLQDGVIQRFDERDLAPYVRENAQATGRLHGTLQRKGPAVEYVMVAEGSPQSDRGTETWQGAARFDQQLRPFPLTTDVQGWHVFRGNVYLRTLPLGKPVPLSSVLDERSN